MDDAGIASSVLAETAALTTQEKALVMQRDEFGSPAERWAASQQRFNDGESWCQLQTRNLETLSYQGRLSALEALGVVARVWSTDHNPRYAITVSRDVLPIGTAVSDPRTEGGAGLGAVHVDGCTRR